MSCLLNMHGLNNFFKITFFKSKCIINIIFVPDFEITSSLYHVFTAHKYRLYQSKLEWIARYLKIKRLINHLKNNYFNNKTDNVSNKSQLKREQASNNCVNQEGNKYTNNE